MPSWPAELLTAELGDLADDVRRMFQELDRDGVGDDRGGAAGKCAPPLDVFETDDWIEVVLDLAGVPATAVRVIIKANVVVLAGEKTATDPIVEPGIDYHLVERSVGRFVRAVRVSTTFDGSRARASLIAGELRVRLPRIVERRGRAIRVTVDNAPL